MRTACELYKSFARSLTHGSQIADAGDLASGVVGVGRGCARAGVFELFPRAVAQLFATKSIATCASSTGAIGRFGTYHYSIDRSVALSWWWHLISIAHDDGLLLKADTVTRRSCGIVIDGVRTIWRLSAL